jgi:hypothetical protein
MLGATPRGATPAAARSALAWVVDNLEKFDPFAGSKAYDGDRTKALVELAIMAQVATALGEEGGRLAPVFEFLRLVQDRADFRNRLARDAENLVLHCFLYAVLRSTGHDNLEHRELIQRALDVGLLDQAERVPHQIMEERLALEWGGFEVAAPSWDDLLAWSLLARRPNPLYLTELPAYSVTHLLLFLFGFGTRSVTSATLAGIRDLQPLLAGLLVRFCLEGHWDLVGELLLCWDCLRLEPSAVYRRAWEALLSRQAEDGSFPGPDQHRREDGGGDRFGERYHTTLVVILATQVHAGRELGPPLVTPSVREAGDAARRPVVPPFLARRSFEWLLSVLPESIHSRDDLTAACQVLVGTWTCAALEPELGQAFVEVAERIAEEASRVLAWDTVSPALSILCHGLLAEGNQSVSSLGNFVAAAAAALEANPTVRPLDDLLLSEKRVLLHRLGMGPATSALDIESLLASARTFRLEQIRADTEGLLLRAGSYTGHGTESPVLPGGDREWLAELIWSLTKSYLHSYDLPLGCKLLRAAVHLDLASAEAADLGDAVGFLLLHHRPSGAFGYLGAEEEVVKARIGEGFSPERDLYLPVSVHCLWALAETTSPWRLYRSIGL